MRIKLDSVITATFLVCAIVATSGIVHREFFASQTRRVQEEQKPIFLKDWRAYLAKGIRVGPSEAPVQLLEFADFECPYCGSFHNTLRAIEIRYPNKISLMYVHFPIQGHRFALPAARVAECAASQGRFSAMHDQLFEGQESFGLKPWSDYATAAGVPDLAAFDACIKKTDPMLRVAEGQALGKELDMQGTPSVIINGWKLGNPPTEQELDRMVKAVLAGKSPVDPKT
jgi:NhaA family Na+:H+ antiporter